MMSVRRLAWIGATCLFALLPLAANAFTVDRVTVTGRGQIRANAIVHAEQAAVEIVARRFIAVRVSISHWDMTESDRQNMIDLLLRTASPTCTPSRLSTIGSTKGGSPRSRPWPGSRRTVW